MPDNLKGQIPIGLLVLKTGTQDLNAPRNSIQYVFNAGVEKPYRQLVKEVIGVVRQHVGPVASFKDAIVVKRLPKTRSGKIARGTIANMVAGKPYKVPCYVLSRVQCLDVLNVFRSL
jgi:propionyl-CoA synthetase